MKKIMLIGVGWEQLPLVKKAKEKGYEVIATTTWELDKIPVEKKYKIDSRDIERLENLFLEEKPDCIMADECDYSMYAVAYLTEKYNLPGPGLKQLTITNNKFLQRQLIEKSNVKQPEYQLCWSLEMARKAADEIGFPVIFKPVDNRGSIGITVANTKEEIAAAFYNAAINSHSRQCLCEEFIDGETIAVDGFYTEKGNEMLFVERKESYQNQKNLDKKLFFPGDFDNEYLEEQIRIYFKEVCSVFSYHFGYTHSEFIYSEKRKQLYFIESSNRGGGVHISNLIAHRIYDYDFYSKYIEASTGKIPESFSGKKTDQKVIMYFLNPTGEKEANEVIGDNSENILSLYLKPRGLLQDINKKGALGREGVLITVGKDFEQLDLLNRKIEKELKSVEDEFIYQRQG